MSTQVPEGGAVSAIRTGHCGRYQRVSDQKACRSGSRGLALSAALAVAMSCTLWLPTAASATSGGAAATTVKVNGPSVSMKVSRPGASASRTFAGKAKQRVTVALTKLVTSDGSDGGTLTLLAPNGTTVDSSSGYGSVGVGPDALTVTGIYTVRLTLRDNTATGTATLWVSAPKVLGSVKVNGSSASMNVSRVGQEVERTFAGKAKQRVTVALTKLVTSDGSDGGTLTLLAPNGTTVDSSSGYGSVGVGPDALTVTGIYTVRLTLRDNTATGTATLWVSAPKVLGSVKVNGSSASMNVSRVGQEVERTFAGKAKQRVTVALTKLVTSDGSDGGTLTLLAPNGTTVDSSSGYGSVGVGPDALTVTGIYTVRLTLHDNTATGTATLWVSAPKVLGSVKVNGSSASMNVSRVGQEVERTFAGKAKQRVTVALTKLVTSDGSDGGTLTLLAPNGTTVDSSSGYGSVGVGPDALTVTGIYTVRLTLRDNTATGTATLWVSAPKVLGSVKVNGSSASMNVSRVGQEVERTFAGKAKQRVTVALTKLVTSDGSDGGTLTLLAPNGTTVDSSSGYGSVGVGPDALTVTGIYTVRLTLRDNTATGTATLRVSA